MKIGQWLIQVLLREGGGGQEFQGAPRILRIALWTPNLVN